MILRQFIIIVEIFDVGEDIMLLGYLSTVLVC